MKKYKLLPFAFLITLYTFSQPSLVLDINSGTEGSVPINLFVFDGLLYFSADDSNGSNTPGNQDLGRELWVSDGTNSGTTLVKDLSTGASNSSPNNFFALNGNLYFSANSGSGDILYISDGTDTGTMSTGVAQVKIPITLGGLTYNIKNSDKKLYVFNGTANTAAPGSGEEYFQNEQFIVFNDKLFCYLNTTSDIGTVGTELYSYDSGVFQLIKDVAGNQLDSELSNFTVSGSTLYFTAFSGSELWKTDGTTIGTEMVSTAGSISGFNNLYGWDGKLFVLGYDGSSNQLWVYDPVLDTVSNISNLTGAFPNHDPSDYAELNGWLYYRGEDSNDNDGHLWRTDGTTTHQLDNTIINVDELVVLNDKLYFEGSNGIDGNELFELDPATLSITNFIADQIIIYPNPSDTSIHIQSNNSIDEINIYNISGNNIIKTKQQHIDISQLQSGLYLIKIASNNGSVIKKIIIN